MFGLVLEMAGAAVASVTTDNAAKASIGSPDMP